MHSQQLRNFRQRPVVEIIRGQKESLIGIEGGQHCRNGRFNSGIASHTLRLRDSKLRAILQRGVQTGFTSRTAVPIDVLLGDNNSETALQRTSTLVIKQLRSSLLALGIHSV